MKKMSNEEAIKILLSKRIFVPAEHEKEFFEAFDMAIEALKDAQNCVHCEHYTERETDTGINGECKMDTAHSNANQHVQRVGCVDLISRQDAVNEIHKYFVEEIDKTPTEIDEDGDELYADMPTVNSLLACNKELSKRIKSLPSAEPKTETVLCALADRTCPFQGKEYAWCLTCPHISEEDRNLIKKAVAEPKTGKWNCDENAIYHCSECGCETTWDYNFCPDCGARMNGGEEE